ncbi:energy-coupling factor transporter transmembrane component T family protein [Cellulomonas fengjieae]|uniref:energy-coupling factor transporter transmembrane component T family protein n=1 Tax=Cellulomonas fengjieae TaxID=2819978 RepID=UPI001AAE38A3|nr:energy-coupling factor transporter transmembrane protein EcfT [Cellulomonas fengjieae]MBO3103012.1 energy-coupling factor transporter transmembrane protein EcfT [Cellulomonas fengjieae]
MSGPIRAPWAGPLGLYHPGSSAIHRAPAGLKLAALAAFAIAVVAVRGPVSALVFLGAALLAQLVARLPWHRTTRGLVPALLTAALIGAYQWWARGWATAVEVATDLVALVLLGAVVTATTRSDTLLDVLSRLARPLRHVGLSPETFGLAAGLVLRTIPVLARMSLETRDAARARGLDREPRALLVPAAVRMVGHARTTGDALAARGLGED